MKSSQSSKFSYRSQYKDRPNNESVIITNLMAELAIALNDKIKLESENAFLKLECEQNKKSLEQLERKILEEKNVFNGTINKLHGQLNNKDLKLKDQDVQNLEEIKTYLSQINDLKSEIYMQKETNEITIHELKNKLSELENELLNFKNTNSSLVQKVQILKDKSVKYRDKFKYAVGLLQKMNNMLQYFYHKRMTANKKCQTETISITHCEPLLPTSSSNYEHENILTELFFKPNPLNENLEALLFSNRDIHKNII